MTDIVTVTLNPAVDVATSVDVVLDTQKLRCAPARRVWPRGRFGGIVERRHRAMRSVGRGGDVSARLRCRSTDTCGRRIDLVALPGRSRASGRRRPSHPLLHTTRRPVSVLFRPIPLVCTSSVDHARSADVSAAPPSTSCRCSGASSPSGPIASTYLPIAGSAVTP